MKRYGWRFYGWLLLALPARAGAQTLVGDGLQGAYYSGLNFEHQVLTRHDANIDFNWHQSSPASGVPAEDFSVRWTGYLVPPVSGRYVLHLTVDDGMRFWLNGRQLLNEWRGQSLSTYQVAVELQAGVPYSLRIDYCQYGYDSRALLAWERPDKPAPNTLLTLWNTGSSTPPSEAIPTRYLFSRNPIVPAVVRPTPAPLAPAAKPAPAITQLPKPAKPRHVVTPPAEVKPQQVPLARVVTALPAHATVPDSARLAVAKRLAAGQAVTLRALRFEQGKSFLLPSVQASLDTLATTLHQYPALRLEVQGHTDNQGDVELNRQLSQQRAEAVCQYLAAHGIAAERLRPVGYGGTQPVADNRNLTLRAQNRRVVLRPLP